MLVVDCQVQLLARTYFEAHVERIEPPRTERANGGYVIHTPSGRRAHIPASHYDMEPQLQCWIEHGIDAVVASMGRFNVDHLAADRARELAMRLNEEQADLERSHPGRYYGLAVLPMQDTQAAIETLDHAVRVLGLRGVCISSRAISASLEASAREPIYSRIGELAVPLFLHPRGLEPADGSTTSARDLVLSGVVDRHPALRVVDPRLAVAPSRLPRDGDGLRRLYGSTAGLTGAALRFAVQALGSAQLLYGSDYPDRPAGAGLRVVHEELTDHARDQVLGTNAAALLGSAANSGYGAVPARTSRGSPR